MTKTLTFATVSLFSVVAAGVVSAQTAPAADPHAGHDMSKMSTMTIPVPTGTALKASMPTAGAMMNVSPTEISMTLPHAMKIDSVVLTNAAGQRIPLSATLSDAEVDTLTTPVPTLAAGTYSVAWTASKGADHAMTGTFGFMVH